MHFLLSRLATLYSELRRRRVFRVVGAYLAGALVVLEGADLILSPLGLGQGTSRVLVVLAAVGLPLAVAFAWAYDITAEGIRRTEPRDAADRDGLPLVRQAQIFGLFVVASLVAAGGGALLLSSLGGARAPERDRLAIFPFRSVGDAVADWAEGVPDLLATALDGSEGLRVADPWSLWRPLRPEPTTRPAPPAPAEAERLARKAAAGRYLLGSVVDAGDSVTVTVRIYEVGRGEPVHVFPIAGAAADLGGAVRRTAVGVLGRLATEDSISSPELVLDPTHSPEALKSYLAAREAMRRGLVDSAATAIDRAIALDSTFVLALVEAIAVKSWVDHARGQYFTGLRGLLEAAEPYADSVNARTRFRLEATRASVETRGEAAIAAARRIIEMDSTDIRAWAGLTYYLLAYGWQVGATTGELIEAAERVVRLDSTYVPGLTVRAGLAIRHREHDDIRRQLARLEKADTTSPLARGALAGLRLALADSAAADRMLPDLVSLPRGALPTLIRHLRDTHLDRTRAFLQRLEEEGDRRFAPVASFEIARLDMARGWPGRLDSMAALPRYQPGDAYMGFRALEVAASLAGIADGGAPRAADALAAYVPVDSVNTYFDSRPVWHYGWLIGAYNATSGDTTLARRWEAAFDTMPVGGHPPQWGASLAADIGARLAARTGHQDRALDRAREAFRLWSVHTENMTELMPEPAMRLHLAALYEDARMADSARALLRSLVPPTGYFGFLTPRAHYELGSLALAAGDRERARYRFGRALEAWEPGGPAVAGWRDQARRHLTGELAAGAF